MDASHDTMDARHDKRADASVIAEAGSDVRELKARKADALDIKASVSKLLALKASYAAKYGESVDPPMVPKAPKTSKIVKVEKTAAPNSYQQPPPSFSPVNNTAVDALAAKASCSSKGYFRDPAVHLWHGIILKGLGAPLRPQAPLVHHAAFYRSYAVELAVRRWIKDVADAGVSAWNVVIVGSGLDPLAPRLIASLPDTAGRFFELDAEAVLRAKVRKLCRPM